MHIFICWGVKFFAFTLRKCKHAMCFTNPMYIFCLFFGVIIPDCQLPKVTESMHKLHKIAYKMSKNCLRGKGGVDVRLGGRASWLLGG